MVKGVSKVISGVLGSLRGVFRGSMGIAWSTTRYPVRFRESHRVFRRFSTRPNKISYADERPTIFLSPALYEPPVQTLIAIILVIFKQFVFFLVIILRSLVNFLQICS